MTSSSSVQILVLSSPALNFKIAVLPTVYFQSHPWILMETAVCGWIFSSEIDSKTLCEIIGSMWATEVVHHPLEHIQWRGTLITTLGKWWHHWTDFTVRILFLISSHVFSRLNPSSSILPHRNSFLVPDHQLTLLWTSCSLSKFLKYLSYGPTKVE